ncbi:MAG: conjugal transfer protein TraF [Candidatus Riflemargulisbacteria bacterium]
MKKILILGILASFSIVFSFNTPEYASAKVMGLGGAYTAIANDEMAMFYNPAGLAYIDSGMVGHLNVEGTLTYEDGFTSIMDSIEKIGSGGFSTANYALYTALDGKSGSIFYGGGISYFTGGIAIGAYTSYKSFMKYTLTEFNANIDNTSILCMGFASKVMDDVALGISLKAVRLQALKGSVTYAELASVTSNFDGMNFGSGDFAKSYNLGANIGTMYKTGNFSLGASIENLFTLEANKELASSKIVTNNTAEATKPIVRIGAGFNNGYTLLAADMANLTDANNTTYHVGIQQKLVDIPFVEWLGGLTARAGYLTGKKDNIDISLVTYGVQARFLIAYLNINAVNKTIDSNKSQEYNFSGQFTF